MTEITLLFIGWGCGILTVLFTILFKTLMKGEKK